MTVYCHVELSKHLEGILRVAQNDKKGRMTRGQNDNEVNLLSRVNNRRKLQNKHIAFLTFRMAVRLYPVPNLKL